MEDINGQIKKIISELKVVEHDLNVKVLNACGWKDKFTMANKELKRQPQAEIDALLDKLGKIGDVIETLEGII